MKVFCYTELSKYEGVKNKIKLQYESREVNCIWMPGQTFHKMSHVVTDACSDHLGSFRNQTEERGCLSGLREGLKK